MALADWRCKRCGATNPASERVCSNCGTRRAASWFSGPALYAVIGGVIFLIVIAILVFTMAGAPERGFKEAVAKAFKNEQLSASEVEAEIGKALRRYRLNDAKAEQLQEEVIKEILLSWQPKIEEKYKAAVKQAYNNQALTEADRDEDLAKVRQRWRINPDKADEWKKLAWKEMGYRPAPPTPAFPPAVMEEKPKDDLQVQKLAAQINFQQGLRYAKEEDFPNAIREFTLAIEKYPDYSVAYANRAVAYMQQKKYNKAAEDLKKAASLSPNDPSVFYNLAALYSLQKQLDLALDALDKALELGFNDYDTLRKDPDLANLRKHSEFRPTLEKHKVFLK